MAATRFLASRSPRTQMPIIRLTWCRRWRARVSWMESQPEVVMQGSREVESNQW